MSESVAVVSLKAQPVISPDVFSCNRYGPPVPNSKVRFPAALSAQVTPPSLEYSIVPPAIAMTTSPTCSVHSNLRILGHESKLTQLAPLASVISIIAAASGCSKRGVFVNISALSKLA